MANTSEQKKVKNIYFNRTDHLSVQLPLDNRELKHATFLSHGQQLEVCCFLI